jgi:crossover junction endodeoxyribonuclease RusA
MDEPSPVGELVLTLPLPPSINHQYATVQGRRVLSRAGREFKTLVVEEVEHYLDKHPQADATLFQCHYLALAITFYFRSALRRDLDGGLKIAQDALCEALEVNDNLVIEIHLRKRVDRHSPRIEVHLTALTAGSVTLEERGEAHSTPPVPGQLESGSKRRRRRKQRSLEELAARHRWDQ